MTTYPEVDPGYSWNTLAPRTGLVWKVTSDGKTVAKASYSRYYEVMYTDEFSNVNPNTISTTNIPIVYTWLGDLNRNGLVENNELGPIKSQYVPRANAIDPDLRNPKNDEIMFAFQREVANNVSFSVRLDPALVQRRDRESELLRHPVQGRPDDGLHADARRHRRRTGQHPQHRQRAAGDLL